MSALELSVPSTFVSFQYMGSVMHIETMSQVDCRTLIRDERLGRLAYCKDDRPLVVPIHYVCSGNLIYCFSMPGQKLDVMRANPNVCFEIENIERSNRWRCVIIQGLFHEFSTPEHKQVAWEILKVHNDWWEVGGQQVRETDQDEKRPITYFSISMDLISGREAISDHR